ncbi:MAG TPA: hypothetical protein VLC28_03320 [Flavitalea sp.]|nr:hypothetical protein [Flavitalea sp.]
MLENLINLVRENAGDAIINNPAIPNERNEEAVQDTSHSVVNSLKNAISGGNIKDVMKIFSGHTDPSNPVVQDATNNLSQNLSGKYGISGGQASGIAGSLIPMILSQLAGKTSDPSNNSFNIQDIFNQLTGGKTSGVNMGGILDKFKGGLDKDGDGDVDLSDLTGLLTGGGSGSMMDKVKGMFS